MPSRAGSIRPHFPAPRALLALGLSLALALAVEAIAGIVTRPAIPGWYAALAKPAFTPPDWVFPVVWTTLFVLMAVAVWLVWLRKGVRGAPTSMALYATQLAFNLGWSVLFFGLRQPASALAAIVFLLVLILATMAAFHRNRPVAAWLMLPYLAWVAFALVLNAAIVWMN